MSFRKRNVVVSNTGSSTPSQLPQAKQSIPGTRPSPLDGRLTISTGTRSLDALLAGHAGLPLGNSILIEENGTTDFGGTLLKYYSAEGITQGHHVHVLGIHEGWGRELPGLATGGETGGKEKDDEKERMKIAWRYERLGEAGVRG
jgi:elongator complex protein 4